MSGKPTLIKVFVASPGDVNRERDSLLGIVNELNRTCDALLGKSVIRLELLRWEADSFPDAGRPQALITEQIGDYDIFIGILSTRFGTPSGKAGSGTEEEFLDAYANWEKKKKPHICLYFNKAAIPLQRNTEFVKQLLQIAEFREKWAGKILYWDYEGEGFFAETVRPHLAQIVGSMFRNQTIPDLKIEKRSFSSEMVILTAIGPDDACYPHQEKYLNRSGNVIEAAQQDGWLSGTFRFDGPLFPGDNRVYSFLQFQVILAE